MKIIVIDEEFPYPPNTGKRIRSFNLIKRLAMNHKICYLAYGTPDSEAFHQMKSFNLNPVAVQPKVPKKEGLGFYFRLFLNLFDPDPYIVTSHYSNSFKNRLNELLTEFRPDLILCEWTPYAAFVKEITKHKKVISAHNVEARIWQRYYENEKNGMKKWYIRKQWEKLQRFERDAFHWVEGAMAVSRIDADEIHSFNHRLLVDVIDNGVDPEYFKSTDRPTRKNRLVFVGTMDWRPNQDAVMFFADEIFPLLKSRIPDLEIYFVGRKPSAGITALSKRDGVTVTGEVDDVRPFIEESAVYVVPLRIGSGTRLKILDAMSMKKAIVSTSVGAEGLEVTDGENILIADEPQAFADKVETLLNDHALRLRLGDNGRELIEKRYGWDYLAGRLEQFLVRVSETELS